MSEPTKLPETDYKIPIKKVKIIGKSNSTENDLVITEIEELAVIQNRTFKKRNPDKEILFELKNSLDEKLQIAHYKNNDFLNVFIDGGVHPSRFVITKNSLYNIIRILYTYYIYNIKDQKHTSDFSSLTTLLNGGNVNEDRSKDTY